MTATAVATALDEDPYKHPAELLLDKCGLGPVFVDNINVHHGKKYEPIGTMFYSFRNNILVEEYGLIQHSEKTFIGASPDGICSTKTADSRSLSKLVGRLLEIKFPKTRKITFHGDLNGDILPPLLLPSSSNPTVCYQLAECDFYNAKLRSMRTGKVLARF